MQGVLLRTVILVANNGEGQYCISQWSQDWLGQETNEYTWWKFSRDVLRMAQPWRTLVSYPWWSERLCACTKRHAGLGKIGKDPTYLWLWGLSQIQKNHGHEKTWHKVEVGTYKLPMLWIHSPTYYIQIHCLRAEALWLKVLMQNLWPSHWLTLTMLIQGWPLGNQA